MKIDPGGDWAALAEGRVLLLPYSHMQRRDSEDWRWEKWLQVATRVQYPLVQGYFGERLLPYVPAVDMPTADHQWALMARAKFVIGPSSLDNFRVREIISFLDELWQA